MIIKKRILMFFIIYATFLAGVYGFYDFIPDDLVTFTLTANEVTTFFENITEPTYIKGAY